MADSDHSHLIAEFCKVTGTDPSRAQLYLEANGWNSDLAVSSYFEEVEEEESSPPAAAPPPPGSPKPTFPSNTPSTHNRVTTLSSLRNDAEDNEEEGQAFYAGGSERSGQQVLGPGKRKAGNEVVEEMFKAVRKFGGEVVDPSQKPAATTLKAFKGAGFILGANPEEDGSTVTGESGQERLREVEIRLRLWQTGFTVDDGLLRDYNDPASKGFLDSVRKGEVPAELLRRNAESEIHLNIEDKSHEEYIPIRPSVELFSGSGFRLGDVVPVVTSNAGEPSEKSSADAQENLKLDETKPVTSVQIRLSDGSRLMMKANHTHTIAHVREFIVLSRPEYGAVEFILMAAFPPKELTEDSATLKESNLLNSVIMQKLV